MQLTIKIVNLWKMLSCEAVELFTVIRTDGNVSEKLGDIESCLKNLREELCKESLDNLGKPYKTNDAFFESIGGYSEIPLNTRLVVKANNGVKIIIDDVELHELSNGNFYSEKENLIRKKFEEKINEMEKGNT